MISLRLPSLVTIHWLAEHLNDSNLIILDASLAKPKSKPSDNPLANIQIPGARFFDIDHAFSDQGKDLPHTMLSEKAFENEARKLGINRDSLIVIYDNLGVYASPRAWWMLRAMGHENVAVLDGGLPTWEKRGFPTEEKQTQPFSKGNFVANYQAEFFKDSKDILSSMDDPTTLVLDARSKGRFDGTEPEPRAGLRGGHIPNSVNMHFDKVTRKGTMCSPSELTEKFKSLGANDKNLIFSCGSGLTACILALAADQAGFKNPSVYDGSWSEWGNGDFLVEV